MRAVLLAADREMRIESAMHGTPSLTQNLVDHGLRVDLTITHSVRWAEIDDPGDPGYARMQPWPILPRWQVFQRRRGGRMALTAEVELGASRLVVYDIHLESKGGDGLRFAQLSEVVLDSLRYPPSVPVVVTGDLNSSDPPSMWSTYMLHFGFQDACAGNARRATKPDGRALDWIFTRGPVDCSESRVHSDIAASDHFPVSTVLTLKV